MPTEHNTTPARKIAVGVRVAIEKGCKARDVTKGATAMVTAVTELGSDYNYSVKVTLKFLNTFLSGKTLSFYASHPNRLDDDLVNLNDGRPEHKIVIRVKK